MFLKIQKQKQRTYLTIAHSYRNPETKKNQTKIIQSLGYLDELEQTYPDPIAHFKQIAKQMNEEEKAKKVHYRIEIKPDETITSDNRKNLGYIALSKVYHELGLDKFFHNRARGTKAKFPINDIMKTEVFSRILFPNSKKSTYENRHLFFEKNDYELADVYRCLSFIDTISRDTQLHIHRKVTELTGRNCELLYYDTTNYYFEIDEADELRKKGVSKEHRPEPIVQMGLLMDESGIPIAYKLFPGNTNDCTTLKPIMKEIKRDFGVGKTIIVADKGLNTHKNIVFNILKGDGYIYSQSVRKAEKELKDYVLDDDGYRHLNSDYKLKSRFYPRNLKVEDKFGKTKTIRVDEKQIIFYSEKYAKKARIEREKAIEKAQRLIQHPGQFRKSTAYGSAKYIHNIAFDKSTGEVIDTGKSLSINLDKIREEERFDGYYAIITNELDKTDSDVIDIYRGLWKIEESFKITKSHLQARPVYLSRHDRINAHFLICFIALVILRLLEFRLNQLRLPDSQKIPAVRIASSLSLAAGYHLQENWYLFSYIDPVLLELERAFGFPFSRKFLTSGYIKNIFSYPVFGAFTVQSISKIDPS